MTASVNVVEIDYNDLVAGADLSDKIQIAYGIDGLGILTVSNVPGLNEARENLLVLGRQFALLPEDIKQKYAHPESKYSFGWSHGIENLEGKPDTSKGSYYNNPMYDKPVASQKLIEQYSPFIHPNIWPTEDLPQLEGAFKALGQLIVGVGVLIAAQCDRVVKAQCPAYKDNFIQNIIETSLCCKARLLHYFPIGSELPPDDANNFSSWCGWHNDHGTLTGLVSAMYMDAAGNVVDNTDTSAGIDARSLFCGFML
jgi:isopenicillin N synthase-like dioxygenase